MHTASHSPLISPPPHSLTPNRIRAPTHVRFGLRPVSIRSKGPIRVSSPSSTSSPMEATEEEVDGFVAVANKVADAAGEVIRKYFRQPFDVLHKDDLSKRIPRHLIERLVLFCWIFLSSQILQAKSMAPKTAINRNKSKGKKDAGSSHKPGVLPTFSVVYPSTPLPQRGDLRADGDAWKALIDTAGTLIREYDQEAVTSLNKFVDQLPLVMNQVTQGTSEFRPTPSENRELFKNSYNVPNTLLKLNKLKCILKRWHSSSRILSNVTTTTTATVPHHSSTDMWQHSASFNGDEVHSGYHPVYVGKSRRRYLVKTALMKHPLFQNLLERSGEGGESPAVIGCEVVLFEHMLWMLENADPKPESLDELVDFYT
ncbi:uncharacterized protein A4U43_C08F27800 [Asparagus officinalis]|nr:uncharacterized protein A4U43_C08F27800 [Asparagus officinalis]